ncbi:MAG TPA: hypothetical protein DEQ83_08285, partial [Rhodobiaceae bacterium]|nr:hypothetical protein [Rhodobiaceae bacterium]
RQAVNALFDIAARLELKFKFTCSVFLGEKHALAQWRVAPKTQHDLISKLRQRARIIKRARIG